MVIKGAARAEPEQLADYLALADKNERVELLELQSPWVNDLDIADNRERLARVLNETFRDWQTLAEGTKQGRDGLYHSQISPAPKYAQDMTREQWLRCAEILAEELGFKDQPRTSIWQSGEDGRPHLHIVWCRTDIDAMKIISDSQNYIAHERASKRMELEFGHEFVPGKHAKRDRNLQPEFPRAKMDRDEQQQQSRTGIDINERRAEVKAIREAADNGPAFMAALEEAGYLLAKGDRGYILVDEKGGHSVLTRNTGLKKPELEAFMAGVDLDRLPTIDEAKELQKLRAVAKAEAAKTKEAQPTEQAPSATKQEPEPSQFLPETQPQPAPQPGPPAVDQELEDLKKALAKRQAADVRKWEERHAEELRQLEDSSNVEAAGKLAEFDTGQQKQLAFFRAEQRQQTKGLRGLLEAVGNRLNTRRGAQRAASRRRELAEFQRRLEQERKEQADLIEQNRQLEIDLLKKSHVAKMLQVEREQEAETERYLRDHEEYKRKLAELEAQQRRQERFEDELEHNDSLRDGPPPPKLGKP